MNMLKFNYSNIKNLKKNYKQITIENPPNEIPEAHIYEFLQLCFYELLLH